MGCGCSAPRSTIIADPLKITETPERLIYSEKKREQVAKFLQSCGFPQGTESKMFDLIEALSRDCQGFTSTPTGGEVTAIKKYIEEILSLHIQTPVLIKACNEFLTGVVSFLLIC